MRALADFGFITSNLTLYSMEEDGEIQEMGGRRERLAERRY